MEGVWPQRELVETKGGWLAIGLKHLQEETGHAFGAEPRALLPSGGGDQEGARWGGRDGGCTERVRRLRHEKGQQRLKPLEE